MLFQLIIDNQVVFHTDTDSYYSSYCNAITQLMNVAHQKKCEYEAELSRQAKLRMEELGISNDEQEGELSEFDKSRMPTLIQTHH